MEGKVLQQEFLVKVPYLFMDSGINIKFNSRVVYFVGMNGSGKTQILHSLRDALRRNNYNVRYLSSNRIGDLEVYRSKTSPYSSRDVSQCHIGNKDYKSNRYNLETVKGDFFILDDKKDVFIKIEERLTKLLNRNVYLYWENGDLKVSFQKKGSSERYSVAVEASGLVNIISILTSLYDDQIQYLLIDEPEVSLHPQLQSYILQEIQKIAEQQNKFVVLATHSAEMIRIKSMNDLCDYVFFSGDKLPKQIDVNDPILKNNRLNEFVLRMGLMYNEGFFARKILLVEGVSDLWICRYLLNRYQLNTDIVGTQIIPVEGKGNFPIVKKLFELMGKEVFVMTDLDGFVDDNEIVSLFYNSETMQEAVQKGGNGNLSVLLNSLKRDIENLIGKENSENLQKIYSLSSYWFNKKEDDDSKKIIKRAVCAMLWTNVKLFAELPSFKDWQSVRMRMEAIFDYLEVGGCYTLRRGTIEDYYGISCNGVKGKPSLAVEECDNLTQQNDAVVKQQYCDILRALENVSTEYEIDESIIVREELLSELAPIVAELGLQVKEQNDVEQMVNRIKHGSPSLFCYDLSLKNNSVVVDTKTKNLDVCGFPLEINKNDDVVSVVNDKIKKK